MAKAGTTPYSADDGAAPGVERIGSGETRPGGTPPYNPFGEEIELAWALSPLVEQARERMFRGNLTVDERLADLHELAQKMSAILNERATVRTTVLPEPVMPSAELIDALVKLLRDMIMRDAPRDATECAWAYGVGVATMFGGALTGNVLGLAACTVIAYNEVRKAC